MNAEQSSDRYSGIGRVMASLGSQVVLEMPETPCRTHVVELPDATRVTALRQ